jgi:hypothetical protein
VTPCLSGNVDVRCRLLTGDIVTVVVVIVVMVVMVVMAVMAVIVVMVVLVAVVVMVAMVGLRIHRHPVLILLINRGGVKI